MTEEIAKIHAWDGEMEADIYKIDAEPCNMLESDKSNKIEDLNFIDGTIFLVEVPKENGKYTFRPNIELFGSSHDSDDAAHAPAFDMQEMLNFNL